VTHPTDATDTSLDNACTRQEYEVSRQDLPLSCPSLEQKLWNSHPRASLEQKLWNSHPRVYLPIEETGTAVCPYCSALYRLVD